MRITFTNDYVDKPHNTWSLLWNDVNIFLSTFLTVGSSSLFSTEIKLNLQSLLITFINTVFLCGPHTLPIGASEHLYFSLKFWLWYLKNLLRNKESLITAVVSMSWGCMIGSRAEMCSFKSWINKIFPSGMHWNTYWNISAISGI